MTLMVLLLGTLPILVLLSYSQSARLRKTFCQMDNSSYFCNRFQKEITRRYASSCNRKCEKLPNYNARRCNGSRVLRGLETHLHYKVFSQPPIKDAVYGTTLHCYGSFAQIGAARATKVVPDTIKGEVYELF